MTKAEVTVQSPEDVRLQKSRFSLLASGNAMILFAIWTVISAIIEVYYQTSRMTMQDVSVWSVIEVVLAVSGVDLIIKLIAGFCARSEGRGKHRSAVIIVMGILVLAISLYNIISYIPVIPYLYLSDGLLRVIISMAVEITVIYAALDLVISAVRVRKILKAGVQTAGAGRDR